MDKRRENAGCFSFMIGIWKAVGLCIVLGLVGPVLGDDQTAFVRATKQLEAGETQAAISAYETLLDQGTPAPEIHRNLAIAYERDGQLARAVAEAYRGWLSAPASKEAEESFLALASKGDISQKRIRALQNGVFATRWANFFALLASVLLWAGVICLVVWRHRPAVVAAGVVFLLLCGIFATTTAYCHWKQPSSQAAWVVGDSSALLLASHVNGAPEVGRLNVLEEVYIQAKREDWKHVKTINQRSGWVADQRIVPLFPWQS